MYRKGDYVAHYKQGVCEVIDVGKLDMHFSDKGKDYYTLKPLYNAGGMLYTPVSNERGQIRDVISADEVRRIVEGIAEIEELQVADEKKREDAYKKEMLKNECRGWIAVMKTTYMRKKNRLASGKRVINIDEKYLGLAEGFLFGELAASLGMSREEVRTYVIAHMK